MNKTLGGFLISRIKYLSGRKFEKLLKKNDIEVFNGAQGRILYVLWENKTLSITEIGRLTSLAKTTLTSMLDRMETAGLIFREKDPHNRRRTLITLTKEAKKFRASYDLVSLQMNELFYKDFSDHEIIEIEHYLIRILNNLESEEW